MENICGLLLLLLAVGGPFSALSNGLWGSVSQVSTPSQTSREDRVQTSHIFCWHFSAGHSCRQSTLCPTWWFGGGVLIWEMLEVIVDLFFFFAWDHFSGPYGPPVCSMDHMLETTAAKENNSQSLTFKQLQFLVLVVPVLVKNIPDTQHRPVAAN